MNFKKEFEVIKRLVWLRIVIIQLSLTIYLMGAGNQVQLNNGMWQAVGFKGGYTKDDGSLAYSGDGAFEFYDIADDTTTWMGYDTSANQLRYNLVSGFSTTNGRTSQLNSVIGLFAIKGKRSKKTSGYIVLDGTRDNVVNMKVTNATVHRGDSPMYRMYVEGQSGVPTIRIDYQANYNGDMFRIKFGSEEEAYVGYFSHENTYDNPATLTDDRDVAGGDALGIPRPLIKETIDFNITDNNITKLYTTNSYSIKDNSGNINPEDFRIYNTDSGNRIEVYELENGSWNRFDTANTDESSNQIDRFTPGRGYWVRVTSQEAHKDGNYTKIGMITKDRPDINEEQLYGTMENGWHMLSFPDADLRYAPTGVFIPENKLDTDSGSVRLFLDRFGSQDLRGKNAYLRGNYVDVMAVDIVHTYGYYDLNFSAGSYLGDPQLIRAGQRQGATTSTTFDLNFTSGPLWNVTNITAGYRYAGGFGGGNISVAPPFDINWGVTPGANLVTVPSYRLKINSVVVNTWGNIHNISKGNLGAGTSILAEPVPYDINWGAAIGGAVNAVLPTIPFQLVFNAGSNVSNVTNITAGATTIGSPPTQITLASAPPYDINWGTALSSTINAVLAGGNMANITIPGKMGNVTINQPYQAMQNTTITFPTAFNVTGSNWTLHKAPPADFTWPAGTSSMSNLSNIQYINGSNRNDTNASEHMVKKINLASRLSWMLYGENVNVRAFPAYDWNGTALESGLIVLSDHLFELNTTGGNRIKTLAGEDLKETSEGTFSARFGEYMLAMEMNPMLSNTTTRTHYDVNTTIEINMPSFSSTGEVVSDLVNDNKTIIMNKLLGGLEKAATRKGSKRQDTKVGAYLVNVNYSGGEFSNSNATQALRNFDDILLAAGARFSVADKTNTKVYRFKKNGKFNVLSDKGSRGVDSGTYDDNITRTINAINQPAIQSITKIKAVDLGVNNDGDKFFMITSNAGTIRLEEDFNSTLFENVPLGDSSIPKQSRMATKGAVVSVYGHKQLLDISLRNDTRNVSGKSGVTWSVVNRDSNWSTDRNGTRDPNVKMPNLIDDLQVNPIWALDFPTHGSLINKLAKYNKEITTMIVQKFSVENKIYYDAIDLTKSPEDWYGNKYDSDEKRDYNDDYQGIFHIFSNQSYLVKVKDRQPMPSSNIAMDDTSSITYTGRAAFDNTLNEDAEGKVQNHISHTLNIKFKRQFIDPLNRQYYNVVALINGKRHYLRDNGQYFTLNINDLDMRLQEKEDGEASDPIFIHAYDGAGNVLKEEKAEDARFKIYFNKPPKPQVSWNKDGSLNIQNQGRYKVEVYNTFISDIPSKRKEKRFQLNEVIGKHEMGWKATKVESTYGTLVPLRIVLKDPDYEFYSDVQGILYAPLRHGHVLKVGKDDKRVTIPYSYLQKQYLTPLDSDMNSSEAPRFNGTNGVDNGVQIDRLKGAGDKDLMFYYYPEGKETQKRLTGLAGARTAYISIKKDTTTNAKAVISITYINSYAGKMFYIQYNNKLYQGRFPSTGAYSSDSTSYDVSAAILKASNVINTKAAQAKPTDVGGYEIEMRSINTQPIVIPDMMNAGGGNNRPAVPNNGGGNTGGLLP